MTINTLHYAKSSKKRLWLNHIKWSIKELLVQRPLPNELLQETYLFLKILENNCSDAIKNIDSSDISSENNKRALLKLKEIFSKKIDRLQYKYWLIRHEYIKQESKLLPNTTTREQYRLLYSIYNYLTQDIPVIQEKFNTPDIQHLLNNVFSRGNTITNDQYRKAFMVLREVPSFINSLHDLSTKVYNTSSIKTKQYIDTHYKPFEKYR